QDFAAARAQGVEPPIAGAHEHPHALRVDLRLPPLVGLPLAPRLRDERTRVVDVDHPGGAVTPRRRLRRGATLAAVAGRAHRRQEPRKERRPGGRTRPAELRPCWRGLGVTPWPDGWSHRRIDRGAQALLLGARHDGGRPVGPPGVPSAGGPSGAAGLGAVGAGAAGGSGAAGGAAGCAGGAWGGGAWRAGAEVFAGGAFTGGAAGGGAAPWGASSAGGALPSSSLAPSGAASDGVVSSGTASSGTASSGAGAGGSSCCRRWNSSSCRWSCSS